MTDLTHDELKQVVALLNYLNSPCTARLLSLDIDLTDSNGHLVGSITQVEGEYTLRVDV